MSNRDPFSLIAVHYNWLIKPTDGKKLSELLNVLKDSIVLDIGGGTGRVGSSLKQDAFKVFVLDISKKMIDQAALIGMIGILGNANALPFPNNSIDRVLMVDTYHHLSSQEATLIEVIRLLKFGGKLVIEEPDIHSIGVKMIAIIEKLLGFNSHFVRPEEIVKFLDTIPNISVNLVQDRHKAWINVEKISEELK